MGGRSGRRSGQHAPRSARGRAHPCRRETRGRVQRRGRTDLFRPESARRCRGLPDPLHLGHDGQVEGRGEHARQHDRAERLPARDRLGNRCGRRVPGDDAARAARRHGARVRRFRAGRNARPDGEVRPRCGARADRARARDRRRASAHGDPHDAAAGAEGPRAGGIAAHGDRGHRGIPGVAPRGGGGASAQNGVLRSVRAVGSIDHERGPRRAARASGHRRAPVSRRSSSARRETRFPRAKSAKSWCAAAGPGAMSS